MSAAQSELNAELGGNIPTQLDVLDAAEQARLANTLRGARLRQQKHLGESIDEALKHIPALLRGPIRRLFD